MTLAEMAAQSAKTNGRLICPRCHCTDFRTYKTTQGQAVTFRYKACRHCGHKLFTVQQPEQVLREIDTVETFEEEGDLL